MGVDVHSIGYGLAGAGFLAFSILLTTSFRHRIHGSVLFVATSISTVWAFGQLTAVSRPEANLDLLFLLELARNGAWLAFLAILMKGAVGSERTWLFRYGGVILAIGTMLTGALMEAVSTVLDWPSRSAGDLLVVGALLTSIYGLIAIEQLYRNSRESQRSGLKYLCLGIGSMFAYDLFLYSNAILIGQISELAWDARGYIVAMSVPLIAIAAQRATSWSVGLFVSRQIVFYGATVVVGGAYLVAVGLIGYYIRVMGGDWGPAVQLVLFCGGLLTLGVFLFSDSTRGKARVFINKHFYANKYDYREEWLRLINTLTSASDGLPLKKRAIKALAQVLDAPCGLLWLGAGDVSEYRCAANWNTVAIDTIISKSSSLIRFLEKSGWVIELQEYERDPSHYNGLQLDSSALGTPRAAFIIPLLHDSELIGLISLAGSKTTGALNFEDRDLLKTAGQQIASYLAQELATEQLAEHRQFEAFNRLTAYIMHDLKNLIAQQSLVVENARKHKSNPVFIEDAIETIRGGVSRMRRVLDHLKQGSQDGSMRRVEIGQLVMEAVSQCADRLPVPASDVGETRLWVRADRDRLLMALTHAIRNAQDATENDGNIQVTVSVEGRFLCIRIVDTGRGMDAEFMRDRLFRPFDSTKGPVGMGIGAHQIQETARSLGGYVVVESVPGCGTKFSIFVPEATSDNSLASDDEAGRATEVASSVRKV